ncbi:anthrone oxygenase family protein [Kordia jejudonensis]|uniref:anthrone oxygenase family protein n=1 Tax=Kordia jejudonensis TaxID=1348245 RepID=UPI0006291B60|nr:anthrone oxygenase family protein [Kordia jejudonensis]
MGFKLVILIIATVLTGLSAGLCFTWTNAITTGIGKLDNLGYLQAFQQMNRTIINPTFIVVFFGPLLVQLISIFLWKGIPKTIMIHLITATLVYFFGLVLVTIFGNVPLNEILNNTNLATASTNDLQSLRNLFEVRWNQLHLIRTISSLIAFVLLIITLVKTAQYQS